MANPHNSVAIKSMVISFKEVEGVEAAQITSTKTLISNTRQLPKLIVMTIATITKTISHQMTVTTRRNNKLRCKQDNSQ